MDVIARHDVVNMQLTAPPLTLFPLTGCSALRGGGPGIVTATCGIKQIIFTVGGNIKLNFVPSFRPFRASSGGLAFMSSSSWAGRSLLPLTISSKP